jgi:hypothetical protein
LRPPAGNWFSINESKRFDPESKSQVEAAIGEANTKSEKEYTGRGRALSFEGRGERHRRELQGEHRIFAGVKAAADWMVLQQGGKGALS